MTKQTNHSGIHFTNYLDPLTDPSDIHDQRKLPINSAECLLAVILALVIGVLDVVLLWAASTQVIPSFLALVLHLVIVGIAFLFTFARRKTGMDTRASSTALIILLFTGIIGAIGTLVMIIAHIVIRADSLTFKEWFNYIYPRPTPTLGESVYDGVALFSDEHSRNYDVLPFMDVMRLGSPEQKVEAINQMVMHFTPKFAPAFHLALKDPVLSVRTLAATSIARLEKHLQSQERKLKVALSRAEQSPELLLAAAQFYDDYAFSGILDGERKQQYVKLAYDFYQRYLRRRSSDQRAAVWIGRLLIRSGQNERAAEWLKQMIDEGRSDVHMLGWYVEVLYNLRQFSTLRNFVRDYAAKLQALLHEERYTPLTSSVQLWLNRSMEARA